MTGTLNKALLIGHLGQDPDIRTMNSGELVAHLSVATSESWKNKSTGARRDATEWHRVVLYKRLAELAAHHLKKGALIYLEGHLQTRKWVCAVSIRHNHVGVFIKPWSQPEWLCPSIYDPIDQRDSRRPNQSCRIIN